MLGHFLKKNLAHADFFQKSNFLKKFFEEYYQNSNSLDPDQARHFVRPGLGPNFLQMLSADDTSR